MRPILVGILFLWTLVAALMWVERALPVDLNIPHSKRVGNPDGRCFGAALEDCARYMRMKSLYGVSEEFIGGTSYGRDRQGHIWFCDVDRVLGKRGWRKPKNWDETWSGDESWLQSRIDAGFPLAVSVGGGHGECLRSLDKNGAVLVNNDSLRDQWGQFIRWANSDVHMSRQQFLRAWKVQGWAIVLYQEPKR